MNNKIIWKSEKEQYSEIEIRKERDISRYSRDGMIEVGIGEFKYKNVVYLIKILRYYNIDEGFKPISSERISDKHAVVEYPDETKPLVKLVKSIRDDDFLYHDTLHTFNDKQTIEEQIEFCHKLAKQDIDNLKDIPKIIDEKISELIKIKEQFLGKK